MEQQHTTPHTQTANSHPPLRLYTPRALNKLSFLFFKLFFGCAMLILVPQPGIEATTLALGARGLNHWTTGQVPEQAFITMGTPWWHLQILDKQIKVSGRASESEAQRLHSLVSIKHVFNLSSRLPKQYFQEKSKQTKFLSSSHF